MCSKVNLLLTLPVFLMSMLSAGVTPAPAMAPLTVHPSNPRYFTDGSGKAVYLSGSHERFNLQDSGLVGSNTTFDYTGYLDFLQSHHHNFIRMWAWESPIRQGLTGDRFYFDPMPFQRPGAGLAQDGQPKFDVTQFNQAYFDRLRSRVIAASDRGIYVMVMLFQGWSVESKKVGIANVWTWHPFNSENNVNGINGDPNGDGEGKEVHTLSIPAITALQEAYVRKVIDTVGDLDNVLYEIANESHKDSTDWQHHMINYIRTYEGSKPKRHPVVMTISSQAQDDTLFSSPAEGISPGDGAYALEPPAANGSKVILTDSDHFGLSVDYRWAWKSFTMGLNPIYLDLLDADAVREAVRKAMGNTLGYATRMNLGAMSPRGDLSSTGYALANPGVEYLIYLPSGGAVDVNLSGASGTLNVEWSHPVTGAITSGGTTSGGGMHSFSAPFSGDAVLYLKASTITSPLPGGGLSLALTLNQTSFQSNQTLILTATLTSGATPLAVDLYMAVQLPNGSLLFLQGGGSFTTELGPLVSNWTVSYFSGEVFRYTFGGEEPVGSYAWLGASTEPGSLNLIGPIVSAPFTFSP
jgi:hypothetical protein